MDFVVDIPPLAKSALKAGFTLIEMSVVLIIIGLIVGGILVGQDLIHASEARAQISQIAKYNAAVNTFYGKYQAIPGDMNIATATQYGFGVGADCTGITGQRDGNGLIDGHVDGTGKPYPWQFNCEPGLFWQDLTTPGLTSLVDGQFPNTGFWPLNCTGTEAPHPVGSQIGEYVPAGKIGYSTWVFVGETNAHNYYVVEGVTDTNTSTTGAGSLPGAIPPIPVMEAYKIDQKIDDGIPTSGTVQAMYILNEVFASAPNAAADNTTTCYNTNANAYSITYNGGVGQNCALSFQMQGAAR